MARVEGVEDRTGGRDSPEQGDCGDTGEISVYQIPPRDSSGRGGRIWCLQGSCCGVWGLGGTELGSCAELHMPQSTLQRAICVFIIPSPPLTHTEAARVETGPGREGMAGPRLAMLPSQLGKV